MVKIFSSNDTNNNFVVVYYLMKKKLINYMLLYLYSKKINKKQQLFIKFMDGGQSLHVVPIYRRLMLNLEK